MPEESCAAVEASTAARISAWLEAHDPGLEGPVAGKLEVEAAWLLIAKMVRADLAHQLDGRDVGTIAVDGRGTVAQPRQLAEALGIGLNPALIGALPKVAVVGRQRPALAEAHGGHGVDRELIVAVEADLDRAALDLDPIAKVRLKHATDSVEGGAGVGARIEPR